MQKVNVATIKFFEMLKDLATMSGNGILPFDKANEENWEECIFFDPKTINQDGYCEIVCNACVGLGHHDIISYYNEYRISDNYKMYVKFSEDCNSENTQSVFIIFDDEDEIVVIKDGEWYFVN